MSKLMRRIFLMIVVTYIGFVGILYLVQRHMQYAPDLHDPKPSNTVVPEMLEINLAVHDTERLESWYYLPHDSTKTVVLFHGNSSNIAGRDFKARALIDSGFGVVLVGYRGYGGNTGYPTEEGLYDDARVVIKNLIEKNHISPDHMIFYGESLGTGVAIRMASEHPRIAGLVLEVPFDSALSVARSRYWYVVGLSLLMKDQYLSDHLISQLKMPKLFLVAGQDTVIPPDHAHRLYQMTTQPKQIVEFPNGKHNNLYDYGAGDHIISFIRDLNIKLSESP